MRISFFSNYLNHHQLPLSLAFKRRLGDNYIFVADKAMSKERWALGYRDMDHEYDFVLPAYDSNDNKRMAIKLALESDVAFTGSAAEVYTRKRIRRNMLTFRYSERLFKRGQWERFAPHKVLKLIFRHWRYRNKPLYMLCASAYAAADYASWGAYLGKTYKWGYFPEVKQQDMHALFAQKAENDRVKLLWVGRLIWWKHPETALKLAAKLKECGYVFELEIIGNGKLYDRVNKIIQKLDLCDCVKMRGSMPPEDVRIHMEQADIFLFTSDFHEGWGAVLNEAMNSGCAVVASHAAGSVPYLLRNGENGFIYRNGDDDDLYNKVETLLLDPSLRERFGRAAYQTLADEWNAETAAERFLELCKALQEGRETPYATGPCSRAEILNDNLFSVFEWSSQ